MRLFFALWPDAGTRAALGAWARALHALCGGRRMRDENLHQTLAFLGSVDADQAAAAERAAEGVVPRAFTLALDEPGYWKHNRIAWAGASAMPAELLGLVAELRAGLARASLPFDPKPFAVHVTLLRDARAPARMPALERIAWPVSSFALVRSVSTPRGSGYEPLRVWGGQQSGPEACFGGHGREP